jgi:hypothetical protein
MLGNIILALVDSFFKVNQSFIILTQTEQKNASVEE